MTPAHRCDPTATHWPFRHCRPAAQHPAPHKVSPVPQQTPGDTHCWLTLQITPPHKRAPGGRHIPASQTSPMLQQDAPHICIPACPQQRPARQAAPAGQKVLPHTVLPAGMQVPPMHICPTGQHVLPQRFEPGLQQTRLSMQSCPGAHMPRVPHSLLPAAAMSTPGNRARAGQGQKHALVCVSCHPGQHDTVFKSTYIYGCT
jgi:hypothetical protein